MQAVQYQFSGFLPPLSTGVSYALGRAIPIKFTLADYAGAAVTSLAAVTGMQIVPVNPTGASFSPTSTDGKGLTYSGRQFLFSWKTTGQPAGSYQIGSASRMARPRPRPSSSRLGEAPRDCWPTRLAHQPTPRRGRCSAAT